MRAHAITPLLLMLACAVADASAVLTERSRDSDQPVTVYTGNAPGPPRDEAAVARLLRRAQERRELRVIVGLNLKLRDEDQLSPAEAAQQVQRLRQAQDAVIARAFESVPAPRVTRFQFIPHISLFAGRRQIERLLADPLVASIQEDRPVPLSQP